MDVTIRPARRRDRHAVVRLLHSLNPDREPHLQVRTERRLRRDRTVTVLVAETGEGRVVGAVLGRRGLLLGHQRDAMRFDGVVVEPSLRNTGIATRLLNALDHVGARQDCASTLGSVGLQRPELHEFYRGRAIQINAFHVFTSLPPPVAPRGLARVLRSLRIRHDRWAARKVDLVDADAPSGLAGEGSDVTWWDRATLDRFLASTTDRPGHLLWQVAAATGAGLWELTHLRWREVHADHLDLPTAARPDGTPSISTHRRVELDRVTAELLAAHRAGDDDALVFADADGARRRGSAVAELFAADLAAAGLDPVPATVLRHTHAVLLLRAGVTMDRVADRLGHHPLQTAAAYRGALGDPDLDPVAVWSAVATSP